MARRTEYGSCVAPYGADDHAESPLLRQPARHLQNSEDEVPLTHGSRLTLVSVSLLGLVLLVAAVVATSRGQAWDARLHPGSLVKQEGRAKPQTSALPNGLKSQPGPPHIIYILIDDMGWNDMGYQSTDLPDATKHMNALAAQGVKLTNYYSMHICTPARAALMTGRYPSNMGMQFDVIHTSMAWGLPANETIFPQYLAQAGYVSHAVGKWHLGHGRPEYLPHNRGFETFQGFLVDEEDYWTHRLLDAMAGENFLDFVTADKEGYQADYDSNGKHSSDIFTQRATDIIQQHSLEKGEQPLFLYLPYQAVHSPTQPPSIESFTDGEKALLNSIQDDTRRDFAAVAIHVDKSIRVVVDTLETTGMIDNAIVVVTSDNGACNEAGGANYPYRGYKHFLFQGGVKVPGFIYSPALLPASAHGTKYDHMMHVTDMLPTLTHLAFAGQELALPDNLDGVDHWDAISGASQEVPRQELLLHYDEYVSDPAGNVHFAEEVHAAYIMGNWKLIMYEHCNGYYSFSSQDSVIPNSRICSGTPVCSSCAGLCLTGQSSSAHRANYLFDLKNDPYETFNKLDVHPDIVDTILLRIQAATQALVPTVWSPEDMDSITTWQQYGSVVCPWINA